MKIYTKTGDEGTTGLFGGGRVRKDEARVEAYGTVDELNSVVGVARAASLPVDVETVLAGVQEDLFVIGAELATVAGNEDKLPMPLLGEARTALLEGAIDRMEEKMPALKSFVVPGGCPAGAFLHQARTVCRRAERRVLSASQQTPIRREILVYLNRLSDLLFVAARRANHAAGVLDVPWSPRT
ncbi:MAG TPA: cob(I)yrinic acid a,c-diamide adenosyltransferase [Polyangiaceae bacterium]|nr:cob(I)yrinic acid a,c-diamide adenosyltransferase [Polyangiaceae bacterium]